MRLRGREREDKAAFEEMGVCHHHCTQSIRLPWKAVVLAMVALLRKPLARAGRAADLPATKGLARAAQEIVQAMASRWVVQTA